LLLLLLLLLGFDVGLDALPVPLTGMLTIMMSWLSQFQSRKPNRTHNAHWVKKGQQAREKN